jgi:hypothetical protein
MAAKVLEFPAMARRWVTDAEVMIDDAKDTIAEAVDLLSTVKGGADAQACMARAHDALRDAEKEVKALLALPQLDLDDTAKRHLTPVPEDRR